MSGRVAVAWANYAGDRRDILDARRNPNPHAQQWKSTPFGLLTTPGDTRRGPTVIGWRDEGMVWPVEAVYDPETDTTRVGFTWLPPEVDL